MENSGRGIAPSRSRLRLSAQLPVQFMQDFADASDPASPAQTRASSSPCALVVNLSICYNDLQRYTLKPPGGLRFAHSDRQSSACGDLRVLWAIHDWVAGSAAGWTHLTIAAAPLAPCWGATASKSTQRSRADQPGFLFSPALLATGVWATCPSTGSFRLQEDIHLFVYRC